MDLNQQPQSPAGLPPISEQPSGFSPVPDSPIGPQDAVGQGMTEEQMKASLQDILSKIDNKYSEFDNNNFNTSRQASQMKSEAISELFDILQKKGIDPNDPQQLQEYLNEIKGRNPELYKQIVDAINAILGPSDPNQTGEVTPDNMNIQSDETLSPNI